MFLCIGNRRKVRQGITFCITEPTWLNSIFVNTSVDARAFTDGFPTTAISGEPGWGVGKGCLLFPFYQGWQTVALLFKIKLYWHTRVHSFRWCPWLLQQQNWVVETERAMVHEAKNIYYLAPYPVCTELLFALCLVRFYTMYLFVYSYSYLKWAHITL